MKISRYCLILSILTLLTIPIFAQTTLSKTNQNSQILKEDPELTKSLQKILKKHKLDGDIKTSDGKLEQVSLVVVDLFDPENPIFGAINPHLNLNPAGMERIFIAKFIIVIKMGIP